MSAHLEISAVGKVSFHSNPKKGNAKECSNYHTNALISHGNKVMLKIIQSQLQQYVNWEFPDKQAGFRKGGGIRDQIANIGLIIEKARELKKKSTSASLNMLKSLTVWVTTNCGTFLEIGIADHLTHLLRNLYAGQEAGKMDWIKIHKGVCQGCILSPCLFSLYAEYIMWNAGLDEAQAGIKIAGRNINSLR